jgi:hypothetical protein
MIKLTDLKVGDKVKYTDKDTNEIDIGVLVRIEGEKYWFRWENDSSELFLYHYESTNYNLELIASKAFTDEELIQELRHRGYSGSLNKTITTTVTVVV